MPSLWASTYLSFSDIVGTSYNRSQPLLLLEVWNSANFALTEFYDLRKRPFLGSSHPEIAAWHTKIAHMGDALPLFTGVRGMGILGSSPRKFQISLIWGMRLVPHACYRGCVDQLNARLMSPVLREGDCVL